MNWAPTAIFLIALAQAPVPAPAPAPPDPIAEAGAHLDAGRYAQAVQVLRPFVETHPDDIAARFNLALAYSMAGQDAEAIVEYGRLLEAKPDIFEANLNLGQLLVKAGRFSDAEALLSKAHSLKEKDARPVYLLARGLAGQQKWAEAATKLNEALALSPDDRDMKLELAETYERAGMKREAMEAWKNLGDDAAALERLGLLQLEAKEPAAAIESFEAVMAKSPTPAAAFALATAYLRNGQPQKSLPLAESIVAKEPSNQEARMFYGRLLRDQKRYDDAAAQFQSVLRLKPDRLDAWNEFTAMLVLLGQYETALKALEQVKVLGGETAAYFYLRAVMLDALKQQAPALESYEKFLAVSQGGSPEEEFKARQRVRMLKQVLKR